MNSFMHVFDDPACAELAHMLDIDRFSAEARVLRLINYCHSMGKETVTSREVKQQMWLFDKQDAVMALVQVGILEETVDTDVFTMLWGLETRRVQQPYKPPKTGEELALEFNNYWRVTREPAPDAEQLQKEMEEPPVQDQGPVNASTAIATAQIVSDMVKPKKRRSDGRGKPVWEAYEGAYLQRYGAPPVRNATVNTLCAKLVDRLGEDAPQVAAFYVKHPDFLYTKSGHALSLCLRDAEKLRTEWWTGRKVTTAQARQEERTGHNQEVVENYLRESDANEPEPEGQPSCSESQVPDETESPC